MKDKKFITFLVLGTIWIIIFVAMMFGAKIHPRVEQLVTFLCIGWFAYWTLSILFGKKQQPTTSPKENANSKKTTKS